MGKARKTSGRANSKKSATRCVSAAGAKSRLLVFAVVIAVVGSALVFASLVFLPANPAISLTQTQRQPTALPQLLATGPQQLEQVDIGTMNLLCAEGLPGAENLDIPKAIATLDQWAARVKQETDRQFYRFRRDPAGYNNSEGYFRMLMLVTVLQQDLGVHYNMQRVQDIDFRRSQDLFIHGMIGDTNGGTCVSMPVIYTAVARRLGYPVKLVLAKAHVFCRWDAPNDRFNIEATNQGMNCFDDEYYKTWPEKVSDAEVRANRYLLSLSPAEELASFMASRGHCLLDNGRDGAS